MNRHSETDNLLTTRLRLLEARLAEIQWVLREPEDDDLVEQAGELGDDDNLEHLAHVTKDEISHIRHALQRVADGTYGRCESCGLVIGSRRLRVLPAATMCIACARASASPHRRGPSSPQESARSSGGWKL